MQVKKSHPRPKDVSLPPERLTPCPPFTYTGMDVFRPFYIKEGRKEPERAETMGPDIHLPNLAHYTPGDTERHDN